jgi:uncharacterized protein
MFQRQIQASLWQYLQEFPAVAILGPRQAGKTTLALQVAAQPVESVNGLPPFYLDLETPADVVQLGDPSAFFARHANRLVILDEVQRVPGLFAVLRGVIDQRRRAGARTGQFLLLGSASIDLIAQSSETLAGRLAYVELGPLLVSELPADEAHAPGALWLLAATRPACAGASSSSPPIWSATSLCSARAFLRKPCASCGPCWRMSNRRCSMLRVLQAPWA